MLSAAQVSLGLKTWRQTLDDDMLDERKGKGEEKERDKAEN
jgi:hypothetical protein